jgi:hypothetical protein
MRSLALALTTAALDAAPAGRGPPRPAVAAAADHVAQVGPVRGGRQRARGATVSTLLPGQTITVTWDEYVDHPGHFRIAFDDDGQDIFVDPKGFEDVSGGPGVLIDGIADRSGGGTTARRSRCRTSSATTARCR